MDEWVSALAGVRLDAPGLAGLKGQMLLVAAGKPVAMLHVDDGYAQLSHDGGPADASAEFADGQTLIKVLRGELNPVVAALQGRMYVSGGDLIFATKVFLGLQVDAPFARGAAGKEVDHAGR